MKKIMVVLVLFSLVGCTQTVDAPNDKIQKVQSSTSKDKLRAVFTTATEDSVDKFYNGLQYGYYFGLKTKMNEDMYLATVLTEVGSDLVGVRENLNYSCSALPNMFSYYRENGGYNTDGRCNDHGANQPIIGNKVYSNRIGNGDVSSGDGYTFRGGGYAQTTGRYNYQIIVDAVNTRVGSSYVADDFANNIDKPYVANLGGMGYWFQVDAGDCTTMNCVTTKWNKYTDTYDERKANYNRIKEMK